MKKIMLFCLTICLTFSFYSCQDLSPGQESSINYAAASRNVDNYDPGPEWSVFWSDEFDGTTLNETYWNYDTGGHGWGNGEYQYYTDRPENIRLENGNLIIEVKQETYSDGEQTNEFTSARINTRQKMEFTYGKVVARIKMPAGGNYIWPAFWLLGKDWAGFDPDNPIGPSPWPECGEIDISEIFGGSLLDFSSDSKTFSTVHLDRLQSGYENYPGDHYFAIDNHNHYENTTNLGEDYHYYAIEWDNSKIEFSLDGNVYQIVPLGEDFMATFKQDYFVLLNVAVGSWWWGDKPSISKIQSDPALNQEQKMSVDWIRVYQKPGLDTIPAEPANKMWGEALDSDSARLLFDPVYGNMEYVIIHYNVNGQDLGGHYMAQDPSTGYWFLDVHNLTSNDTITLSATFKREEFQEGYSSAPEDVVTYNFIQGTPTVETPVISPESGAYDFPLDVTISCSTDGAEIYYTLDGSSYQLYTGGITITDSVTVTSYATKVGLNDSAPVSQTFTEVLYQWGHFKVKKDVYLWFNKDSVNWVDAHYKINGGTQENINMTYNVSNGRYEYNLGALKRNTTIDVFFTYELDGIATDTPWESTIYTGK